MKILVAVLSGLGIACLLIGAALWIRGWTIVQRNREFCEILQQHQARYAADIFWEEEPAASDVVPLVITNIRADTCSRKPRLDAYSKAIGGLTLTFFTLAIIGRRRQKLPDTEHQTSEVAMPSRPDVSGRPKKKEGLFTRVLGIGRKQSVSTH